MNEKKAIIQYISVSPWVVAVSAAVLVLGILADLWELALLGAIFLLAAVIDWLPVYLRTKKFMSRLEARGLVEIAAEELRSGEQKVIGKNKAILTSNFLFCRNTGVVMPLGEIPFVYLYQLKQTVLFIPIRTFDSLMIGDGVGNPIQAINLGGKDKKEELKALMMEIYQYNPRTLVGHTPENLAAYKALRKQNKA